MATILPMSNTPVRQPFSVLDAPRLSKLSNIKNRQNGISSTPTSLKRRQVTSDLSDSENVDPSSQKSSSSKRKRSEDSDDIFKPMKQPTISLTTKPRLSMSSIPSTRTDTPRLNTSFQPTNITPASAPAAAGRSPKSSKRVGILSRSRRGRIEPPSFGAKARNAAPQLSLAAALNGTMAYSRPTSKVAKHVPTLEESVPRSWSFDIHEDTPEEEMVNLMGHSTCTLDISDDESRLRSEDERGKENIPPSELPSTSVPNSRSTVLISRKDAMTDETRSPLGDLQPEEFYAKGCDATSFIVVSGDNSAPVEKSSSLDNIIASTITTTDFNFSTSLSSASLMKKAELDALISGSKVPSETTVGGDEVDNEDAATEIDIEIWESGSAKEDADGLDGDGGCGSIFAV